MNRNNEDSFKVIKPFGPSIARVKMSKELIDQLNNYVDKIIIDETKSENLNHGDKLAGNVTQEFRLEDDFINSSGFGEFLFASITNWIKFSENKEIKEIKIISSWIVRQFQNEYNPVHWHGGHISGVGYLKIPKTFGQGYQKKEKTNKNGQLELIHGSKQFLSPSSVIVTPQIGYFYFFPHYLMHTVYPFNETNEERRSVSFNALIDEKIFNVYGN